MIVRNDSITEGSISELTDYQVVYGRVFQSILDNIEDGYGYSLRKIRTNYTGNAIRVRRASDNTELNIGFDANGDLDVATLDLFCSGTNGFVRTWYDQGAVGLNVVQTTASKQPKIYDSSTGTVTLNGKPAMYFDGTDDTLLAPSITLTSWFSMYHVGKYTGDFFFEQGSGSDTFFWYGSTEQIIRMVRGGQTDQFDRTTPGNWTGSQQNIFWLLYNDENNSGAGRVWKSFSQLVLNNNSITAVVANNNLTADLNILSRNQTSLFTAGYMQELSLFNNDREGNRIQMTNDMLSYYNLL